MLFTTNRRGGDFVSYRARHNDGCQMTASGVARVGGGNARSSADIVAAESARSAARRFSRTCEIFDAFGIAIVFGRPRTHASELRGRRAGIARDRGQLATAQQIATAQGGVGHDRQSARVAESGESPFDAALGQVVEHLVRCAVTPVRKREQLFHVVDVEIGDAPANDLAVTPQPLECIHRFRKRYAAAPMQQIQVQPVGRETLQAALARRSHAATPGIVRINLADQKHVVAPADGRLRDPHLGTAVSIHLRGIDERHPEIETRA